MWRGREGAADWDEYRTSQSGSFRLGYCCSRKSHHRNPLSSPPTAPAERWQPEPGCPGPPANLAELMGQGYQPANCKTLTIHLLSQNGMTDPIPSNWNWGKQKRQWTGRLKTMEHLRRECGGGRAWEHGGQGVARSSSVEGRPVGPGTEWAQERPGQTDSRQHPPDPQPSLLRILGGLVFLGAPTHTT